MLMVVIIPPEVFHAEQESNESVQSRGSIPNIVINEVAFERDDSESPSIAEYLESVRAKLRQTVQASS
jgi:hypothetical protein